MKRKFSIVIPVYNTERYIKKCLDSIKNQTYDNYEVIIINDGSTDKSLEIINEYTKDKRFKVYSKKNGGLSNTRNYALKYITGDYICFLDSDDYYNKDLLLKLSEIKEDYDIIRYKTTLVDEEGKIIRNENNTLTTKEIILDEIKDIEFLEFVAVNIVKKEFFLNNKFKFEPNRNFEDYGLMPYCLAKAKKIYSLDYYGHNYVQRKGSIIHTTNPCNRMDDLLYHYKKITKKIENDKEISEHNKEIIKSSLAVKLIYSLKYVPLNNLKKYEKLIKETTAIENIKSDSLKKKILKKSPILYSCLIKIKDNRFIKKINFKLLITLYIIMNIIFLFTNTLLFKTHWYTLDRVAYNNYYLLAINCLIIVAVILKKKYKYKAIDLFLLVAILLGGIATMFAVNQDVSIFGSSRRREGFLQICYYISLTILVSFIEKDKYKKPIIYTIFGTGIFQVILGIIQMINHTGFKEETYKVLESAFGTISNPNFYGTYMILCLLFAVGLFIDEKSKIKNIIFYILILLFVVGVLISNALSCILAYILVLTALIVYLLVKKKFLKIILLVIGFIVPLILLTKLDFTYAVKDLVKTKNEVVEISKGNLDDNFGTDRMYLWKNTLKIVPDHIWNGVGIDNFAYAFDGKALPVTYSNNVIYDKAHNEYLQTLVTQGIFALICWFIIHALIVNEGLISLFKDNKSYMVIPVIGYIIQSLFNISVIEVAPIFYIALGFSINRERDKILK